ncbi:LysR family transcriptional regulator [Vibrio lentus]|uniref:LysR family transcriptional regulator n=1 Tax=Vibrio lentus TaxID=136468 RepID=UPI0007EED9EC|nr:LysR family transcriptional regulator [Vibrio lentus]OBS97227.1 LysR family transcriptional regulator [Vibrio tasmaniensis]PMH28000.1 LysR family transcriptional regulator [Vibrio lentus]PMK69982.1 LysR family transcriptional regulator [Vibrio lentus]
MNVLTSIKSFIVTVEEGSFTRAAKKIGVSKSLVSRHVRELETYLNTRLLNRSTKSLSLTEAGRRYFNEAHGLVDRIEDLNDSLIFDSSEMVGALSVMAPKGLTEIMLMPFILEFSDKYPDLNMNLMLSDDVQDLATVGYDIAIRSGDLVSKDLGMIARTIIVNQNLVCASPKYLANRSEIETPSDLVNHRIIEDPNLKNDGVWRFEFDGDFLDVNLKPSLTVNSVQAVKVAVRSGYGIAMLPRQLAQEDVESGSIVEILPQYVLKDRTVYALYRERVNTPRKVKVFIDELCEYFSCC